MDRPAKVERTDANLHKFSSYTRCETVNTRQSCRDFTNEEKQGFPRKYGFCLVMDELVKSLLQSQAAPIKEQERRDREYKNSINRKTEIENSNSN